MKRKPLLPIIDQETGDLIFPVDKEGRPIPVDEFIIKISKNMKMFVSRISKKK